MCDWSVDNVLRSISEDEDDDLVGFQSTSRDLADALNDASVVVHFGRRCKECGGPKGVMSTNSDELMQRISENPSEDDIDRYLRNFFGVTKIWLGGHPEGADRGGYVPYIARGDKEAYYYEGWMPS